MRRMYEYEESKMAVKKRPQKQVITQGGTFRLLFDNHPLPMWIYDLETLAFVEVNDAALQKYGYAREEFLGMTLKDIRPAEDVPRLLENIKKNRPAWQYSMDWRHRLKDGRVIHVEITSHTLEYNNRPCALVMAQDVTERKQTEANLRRSDEIFRLFIEHSPAAIAMLDSDMRYIVHSKRYLKDYGLGEQTILGKSHYEVFPEIPDRWKEIHRRCLAGAVERSDEDFFIRMDGSVDWVKWEIRPWHETDGRIGGVILFSEIITEQKKANNALRDSEEKLQNIIRHSSSMFYAHTTDHVLTYVSPQAREILDCEPEEAMVGWQEFLSSNPLNQQGIEATQRAIQTGERQPPYQLELITRKGRRIWTQVDESPIVRDGKTIAIVGSVTDITERRQAEQELRETKNFITTFLELAPISIYVQSLDNRFRLVNRKWEEDTRVARADAIEHSIHEIFHPDTARSFELQNRQVLESNSLLTAEDWIETPNGLRCYHTIKFPLFDAHGLVESIGGISLDITEGRQAEEERKRLIGELEERVKEQMFLHVLSGIFMDTSRPEEEVLQEVADIAPAAWQYPEIAAARVGYNGTQYTTANYKKSDWMQIRFFDLPNGDLGFIEVVYLEERPEADEGPFLQEESQLITLAAGKLQTYLRGKMAERTINRHLAELETLYESGLAINRLRAPKEIAQKIIETLEKKMDWHHIAIREYDARTNRLQLIGFNKPGISAEDAEEYIARLNEIMFNPAQGLSGWVLANGRLARVPNVLDDERYTEVFPEIRSGVYVPLQVGGQVIGSIAVESESENAFSEHDERLLETLAGQAAVAMHNAKLFHELQIELIERRLIEEDMRQLNSELEQRVRERTLQTEAAKRRLELAAHAGQIGVWEYIPRENKVVWDERMFILHHASPDDFDGTPAGWAAFIHPEDIQNAPANIQMAGEKNLAFNNEHRIVWKDGTVRHIAANAVTVFAEDGLPERLIGTCMDITERKRIETSLREREAYARLLFDAAPDPVSVAELDGTMVDVNLSFEAQHRIKCEELRGRHISELGIFPPEELEKAREYIAQTASGEKVPAIELKYRFPGGGLHTLEMHSYPIMVGGRRLILSTSRDITEHKQLEEALKLANVEMGNALQIKEEFLANMSHELRTPLNAILGISESLEEQIVGTLNEKQSNYVRIIKESGRHLLELINDILDISKIEAGRLELDFQPLSVEKLCQSSLRMVKEIAQKKSLNISLKISEKISVVMGDERRLKQALVNLLSNAIKFTEQGKRIGMEVTGDSLRNQIHFTVWDTGIGIAAEDIQHLFKPFVQLDSGLAREYQGSGLGLALVAQMIRLHGGNVNVESAPGLGSRFTITLPWQEPEQKARPKVTGPLAPPRQPVQEKRAGRILLVEDTDIVVSLLNEYLTHKGYEVLVARNGVDGIRMAKDSRPDLILMDVMMPILDGIEAANEIRKDPSLRDVPIAALTALAMPGDRERCFEAGMNDYMSKPVKMDELTRLIEKYIPQKKD